MQDKWKVWYYNGSHALVNDGKLYSSYEKACDALYRHRVNYCGHDTDSYEYEVFMSESFITKI